MQSYKVTLFGHRDLYKYNRLEKNLYSLLEALMRQKPHVEIYIGRNGDFDLIVASVVKRLQLKQGHENCGMILVLPCKEEDSACYERYYDSVIVPEVLSGVCPDRALHKRNRWMVEQCDLLVCYAEGESGGAFAALKYAKKLHKKVINLAADKKKDWANQY